MKGSPSTTRPHQPRFAQLSQLALEQLQMLLRLLRVALFVITALIPMDIALPSMKPTACVDLFIC